MPAESPCSKRLCEAAWRGMYHLRKCVDRIQGWLERQFPDWAHRRNIRKWDRQWNNPAFNPFWKTDHPQREFLEATDSGWFARSELIIDLGCGNGEVSRWLADKGFKVLGVDYSRAAVENCRRLSAAQRNAPIFALADLCDPDLQLKPAGSLIDRGCFHRIPDKFLPVFAKNVARATIPGGHFLLLSGTFQRADFSHYRGARSEEQLKGHVGRLFETYFAIDRAEPASINAGEGKESMPAVAFWMTRK